MASHPYISGAGNVAAMINQLRKNFPQTVTSDTVKKLGLASNNESYVINALKFLGLIDEEGKRTERGHDVLTTHDEEKFKIAFEKLVKDAYKELFEIRGDEAWTMTKDQLIGFFRSADKTSDLIGTRQAGVFQVLRGITGREPAATAEAKATAKPSKSKASAKPAKAAAKSVSVGSGAAESEPVIHTPSKKDMALTVRIEINLPSEASAETYDNIFRSIKANLLP